MSYLNRTPGTSFVQQTLNAADARGHKHASAGSASGALVGALLGSFLGPVGAAVGAAAGATVGYRVGSRGDPISGRGDG
jgi:uncharacterized membrane protein